jgi:hypothetical protein
MGNKELPKSPPKTERRKGMSNAQNLTKKITTMMKYRQPLSGDWLKCIASILVNLWMTHVIGEADKLYGDKNGHQHPCSQKVNFLSQSLVRRNVMTIIKSFLISLSSPCTHIKQTR